MKTVMSKILIVEDEPQMRCGLRDNLEFEGYQVDLAEDGAAGLAMILDKPYDLIVLDVMMPKMNGFDVCKQARQKGVQAPIIMLTAKGEEIDRVLGLEIGADDYVTKPFSLRELLARIRAIMRRTQSLQGQAELQTPVIIGQLEVHFAGYECRSLNGAPQTMTHKEFEVLRFLWQRRNNTVSREVLLNEVWGYDEMITTRTIDNFIVRLRQKIETDPSSPKHILTVHGIGYKLIL
jgi:DNA-binding response OmpR family regulator